MNENEIIEQILQRIQKQVAEELEKIRIEIGLSIQEFAILLKKSKSYNSELRNGKNNCQLSTLAMLDYKTGYEVEIRFKKKEQSIVQTPQQMVSKLQHTLSELQPTLSALQQTLSTPQQALSELEQTLSKLQHTLSNLKL